MSSTPELNALRQQTRRLQMRANFKALREIAKNKAHNQERIGAIHNTIDPSTIKQPSRINQMGRPQPEIWSSGWIPTWME